MEAPHIDIRGVKYFKDLNNKLNIRKQEANNTHPIHYIPFNLDSYNNITQQISSNNIFPDQYLLPQNKVEEIEINSLFSWKSKGDLLQVSSSVIGKVAAAIASAAAVAYVDQSAAAGTPGGSTYINVDPGFGEHVNNLRGTMFYVCQGSCLCGTVNNRGKVIYCYGDLVPRHGELFAEGEGGSGTTTSKDLLAAQLGIWTFGIFALLIVLILIRKSITSLRKHLQKVTERLPLYHDDDASSLAPSATSPSISGNKTPAPGDKPADPSMVGQQPNNVAPKPSAPPAAPEIKVSAPAAPDPKASALAPPEPKAIVPATPEPRAAPVPFLPPPILLPPPPQSGVPVLPPPLLPPPPKQQPPQAESEVVL